MLNLKLDKM
jgi:hypothetical protein